MPTRNEPFPAIFKELWDKEALEFFRSESVLWRTFHPRGYMRPEPEWHEYQRRECDDILFHR